MSAIHANYSPNFALTIQWLHLLLLALNGPLIQLHILPMFRSVTLHKRFLTIQYPKTVYIYKYSTELLMLLCVLALDGTGNGCRF